MLKGRITVIAILVISLGFLGCAHTPRLIMAKGQAIEIANRKAESAGYWLTDFKTPKAIPTHEEIPKWNVYYDPKVPGKDGLIIEVAPSGGAIFVQETTIKK